MLVAVIFMLAILIISMAVAVPMVRKSIQRDREVETMQRGKQYVRAIQLYYRKFHRYPPNIDALVKTNEIRFLRKRYTDPMTGKDDWKPIQFGQNKTPLAVGFFGQALGGAVGAGTGPGGVTGATSAGSIGLGGWLDRDRLDPDHLGDHRAAAAAWAVEVPRFQAVVHSQGTAPLRAAVRSRAAIQALEQVAAEVEAAKSQVDLPQAPRGQAAAAAAIPARPHQAHQV